jgi:hypothetical protein
MDSSVLRGGPGGLSFVVSDEDENEIARLRELNSELESSIKRCRAILSDCRKRLAANTNVPEALKKDEESLRG